MNISTDIFDQYLCKQAGLESKNLLRFLIRRSLLKFCLHNFFTKLLTSITKSSNLEEDIVLRYSSHTNTPYDCLFCILDLKLGILIILNEKCLRVRLVEKAKYTCF